MSITKQLRGTSEAHFRISLNGPTIYQGTADPVSSPPTPIDTLKNGDLYIRTGLGREGLWIYEAGTFGRMPSAANGGSFNGTVTFNGTMNANGTTNLGDSPTDLLTINALTRFPNAINLTNAITIGSDAKLFRSGITTLRTEGNFEVSANQTISGNLAVSGTLTMSTNQLLLTSGTVTNPGIAFSGDLNTGLYAVAADEIGLSTNSTLRLSVGNTRIQTTVPVQVIEGNTATPGFSFVGDTDSGLTQDTDGEVNVITDAFVALRNNNTTTTRYANNAIPTMAIQRSGTIANGNEVSRIDSNAPDDAANNETYSRIRTVAVDVANTTEDGRIDLYVKAAGSLTSMVRVDAVALFPATDNVSTLGKATNRWTTMYGQSTSTQYGDLAERYSCNDLTYPGLVMEIREDATRSAEVQISRSACRSRVLGVVSTNPGVLMNDEIEYQMEPVVALRGRVPVLYVGKLQPGDRLVTRETFGRARKAKWWEEIFFPSAVFAKVIRVHDRVMCEAVIL